MVAMSAPIRLPRLCSRVVACLALVLALACDEGNDDETTTTTSTSDSGGDDVCSDPEVAIAPCDGSCAFEPATVDCAAACQNIADQCSDPACEASDQCANQNQDVATCTLACEAIKGQTCGNVVFGCWHSAGATASCEYVGICYENNA